MATALRASAFRLDDLMGDPAELVHDLLSDLLPDPVTQEYAALLASGGRLRQRERPVDEELVSRGLAYLTPHERPARLMAVEPLVALASTLSLMQQELATRHERLLEGYAAMVDFQRRFEQQRQENSPSTLVRLLTDQDEIAALSKTLIHEANHGYDAIFTMHADVPLGEESVVTPTPHMVERGVRYRGLYSAEYLAHLSGEQLIRKGMAAGMQVRVMADLPLKLHLVDQHVALIALTLTGTNGALLVRSTVLLTAFRQYFEMLWARATPLAKIGHATTTGLSRRERDVLILLANGLKDETIARRLNVSLRTVRRSVTTIMDRLQVTTRFAAGVAAQRQGLLD
ncbi:LuxR C-terminal-related transcriptional regulator [Actinoallomurus sp. CA-150999]|uniref:helix-turn-helix transcriptional regulator n=1 Tax=Actinoallomurus sp. CA-150999 TaxID=3239887 RepID=UPI003D8AAEAD